MVKKLNAIKIYEIAESGNTVSFAVTTMLSNNAHKIIEKKRFLPVFSKIFEQFEKQV